MRVLTSASSFIGVGLILMTAAFTWAVPHRESAAFQDTGVAAVFPGTETGRRAEAYFQAFNSSDENDMRAYLGQNFSPESFTERPLDQRMAVYRRIKGDLTSLEPQKVSEKTAYQITVIASTRSGQWVEVGFQFEESAPHFLTRVGIMLLPEPPDLDEPSTPITQAEMLNELEAYLEGLVAKDEFSGVVLVAEGESPLLREAYGLASREYNVPNRVDTRFNLGSINKFITRIAIEQLAAKGVLAMEETIGKYLPDYPNKDAAEKVTIRHLLDMTSGIGDFFGEEYMSTPKDRIRSLGDYLSLFAGKPLSFEPGTDYQYSNGGYVVLGLIIEKASGQSYFDYVHEHIYRIAGMESTAHLDADVPTENVASGYTRNWGGEEHPGEALRNNIYTRPARGSSAGGGYSTAGDLLRLILALRAERLSAPDASRMVNEQVLAIAGGAPGINAFVLADPETDYAAIVLSNCDPPAAMSVGRKIESYLKRVK